MPITDQSTLALAVARGGANRKMLYRASIANAVAGTMMSLWRGTGIPATGSIPGATWTSCNASTTGALSIPSLGTETLYLTRLAAQLVTTGSLIAYDRKGANGGLSGTVVTPTAQTVNSENAADANDEWFLEWYTDTGGTAVTATITYTNQSDVTGRTTTVSLAATRRAGMMLPILPAATDQWIKSIQSVTLSATTGTAGSFGVTLARRVAEVPVAVTNQVTVFDAINLGLPSFRTNPCIFFANWPSTTSTGIIQAWIDPGYA